MLLIIDADKLEPKLLRVDEDNFIGATLWPRDKDSPLLPYQPRFNIPEAIRQRAWERSLSLADKSYDANWLNKVSDQLDTPGQMCHGLSLTAHVLTMAKFRSCVLKNALRGIVTLIGFRRILIRKQSVKLKRKQNTSEKLMDGARNL